jgi:hypothetical protein
MASVFTFNKDGKYDGYVGNAMYHLIPTLLELPDIKCGEFREKFNKLIDDLVSDINNINDPSKKMLYDDNIHLKNAREVIRAMFACFNCILQKIKDENNTVNCIEKSETNLENPILNMSKSLGILQQTFNSKEIQLNMSDFPAGAYFVIVESDDKKETFKVIKK